VGDVTFPHTRQKRALSLEPSPVHVAWSGVIGRTLVGLRTGKLMSAQGDGDGYDVEEEDDEEVDNDDDE